MGENLEVVVDVIKNLRLMLVVVLLLPVIGFSQDTTSVYKKRVLENVEIDLLSSYYNQDGNNASVTGGIGTEKLLNYPTNINVAIPLNDDDIFVIDATVSAYTSASSSNLNPFSSSGASNGEDDEDHDGTKGPAQGKITGSPWTISSGASKKDMWISANLSYSHYSDNRNNIYSGNVSVANEYDYSSLGFGAGYTRLFNKKNTEIGIKANVYLDQWRPEYPTEIVTYAKNGNDLNVDFFNGVEILDNTGTVIDKNGADVWAPQNTSLVDNNSRNTYSVSLSFSQILGKNAQVSLFSDIISQQGWLANPMQRVYFKDIDNYYIGEASSIPNYTSESNKDVFQLADDIERLPDSRVKIPVGIRFNYYISEVFVLNTYYRYYSDNWGISSNTASLEIPIKISQKFTLYPSYRYYNQVAADYFAPYEEHLSTQKFYTSDYDLSAFNANQYSFGIKYTDIFTKVHISKLRLKTIDLNYSYYSRDTGLEAKIISLGMKFIVN